MYFLRMLGVKQERTTNRRLEATWFNGYKTAAKDWESSILNASLKALYRVWQWLQQNWAKERAKNELWKYYMVLEKVKGENKDSKNNLKMIKRSL